MRRETVGSFLHRIIGMSAQGSGVREAQEENFDELLTRTPCYPYNNGIRELKRPTIGAYGSKRNKEAIDI